MQVHLDRLESQFPTRKVAIIAFSTQLRCFFDRTGSIDLYGFNFKHFEDGMDCARRVRPAEWNTVKHNVEALRAHVQGLVAGGSTALGPALAVALGLAREHKRETEGALTEIFLCTDGASNMGIGTTDGRAAEDVNMHGRPFYSQAGEIALENSAKINIIGIEQDEGVALDILAVAAQISGGVVTTVRPDELRRQIRTASQRRILAKNITVKLHAPKGWEFFPDPWPGIVASKNTLTYTLAQIDDETDVGFAFGPSNGKAGAGGAPLHFQAQITYTSESTGDTNVRILNRVMPTTSDREHAEAAVEVAVAGTYILQNIAFAANQVLIKNMSFSSSEAKAKIKTLRDELYAGHQFLIRGAKMHTQQEELGNFTRESSQLDLELERMMNDGVTGTLRDQAAKTFVRMIGLSRNSLLAGSRKVGQVKRRVALK